ncbi:MAG: class I SAM-dependent rRNA methyltransferase [Planctomycetota bacterium]|jgi:23S rRNA (cytosine1962-C5)-methyltransferase
MHGPLHPLLVDWPAASARPIRLRVSASAESALRRGHPWLPVEKIQEQSGEGRAGDLAVVYDKKRAFLALGLYDPHSPIRMRVLRARDPGPVDRAFFAERVAAALARRTPLADTGPDAAAATDGYRLIHGESDGLPGCVVDRYADTAVVKLYSHAWLPHLALLLDVLLEQQPCARVVLRQSRLLADAPELLGGLVEGQVVFGSPAEDTLTFRENGLRFEVDPVLGQKTGFFLDQRDNRARVGALAGGRRVLNVFSYTGGFSLAAARGGAPAVCSLDQSGPALAAAERNFALNAHLPAVAAARHELLQGDAFAVLADLAAAGRRFDVVILDPPSFARRRAQVPRALDAYARLTGLGLELLAPAGTLVSASCSSPVGPEDFREAVCSAARRAGRPLRDIEETGHPLDHPLDFAESRYLKCLFATA